MANVILFCEGKNSSLDYKIFGKLFPNMLLIPLGGKYGSPAFLKGYMHRGGVIEQSKAYFLRDRDFDFAVPDQTRLIDVRQRENGMSNNGEGDLYMFATYRTTLENYLIDNSLLIEFLNININENLVAHAAIAIKNYSIVRHALGELRKSVNLNTTWMINGSGSLPETRVLHSIDLCRERALQLLINYRNALETVSEQKFDDLLHKYNTKFSNPSFDNNEEYLIWFHGKDLQKAISNRLQELHISISWSQYYSFAIDRIDFTQFPDYAEYVDKVRLAAQNNH